MVAPPVLVAVLLAAVTALPVAAQQAPPPTPVPPDGSPSPYPTALETPRPSTREPRVAARSALLADLDSGNVLWERNPDERRPIASVTKVMTGLLVGEATDPDEVVTASRNAASQTGAVLGLGVGESQPVRQLLMALMLQSANDAAVALAEHVGGTVDGFVDGMNRRARRLGARDTRFASPNGLDDDGFSTAHDIAAITVEAFRDPTFREVVATKFHRVPAPDGEARRIQNRNALLWLYRGAIGVKTGFTSAAGFCLVAAAERDGLRLVAVVLGAPSSPWSDAAEMLNHGFETWERRTVVDVATGLDPVEVEGREVAVRADGAPSLLLRRGETVHVEVEPEAELSLPVAEGEAVGEVVVRDDHGDALGRVRAVSSATVAGGTPAAPPEDPWWERAWDAVTGFFGRVWRSIFGD
ncbi:MAG TPA: D-alanyl-D-alanine carboxypeptidase family protein [Actinomycetota bacterium]|nr:D-alanyl-D-alanine carboxypeptidase family protein [Actinomycetota bacterium]